MCSSACSVCSAQGRAEKEASLTVQGYPTDPAKEPPLGLPLLLPKESH